MLNPTRFCNLADPTEREALRAYKTAAQKVGWAHWPADTFAKLAQTRDDAEEACIVLGFDPHAINPAHVEPIDYGTDGQNDLIRLRGLSAAGWCQTV